MSKQNNSEKWCTDCSFLVGCRLHICKNPDLEISGNFFSRKFLRLVSKSEFLGRILLLFFLTVAQICRCRNSRLQFMGRLYFYINS